MASNAPSEPKAFDVIMRSVKMLKKIGTPTQKRDAELIELRLMEQPAEAVNFAREDVHPESEDQK